METGQALIFAGILFSSGPAVAQRPAETTPAAISLSRSTTKLVDVGGRRIAFHIMAGSQPAVVFNAGGGMDSSAWNPVLGTIYRQSGAELITYDRAGYGESDEDVRPYELQHDVDDLKRGLSIIGATHGLIFVAHSFGGEVDTVFADQNPCWIDRAVLVDTVLPSFLTNRQISQEVETFPKNVDMRDKQGRATAAILKAFPSVSRQFHTMRWPTSIPATVIVSEHPPLTTPQQNEHWMRVHLEFARAAPNRTFVLAKGSSHMVMSDRPDLVAKAVVDAIAQARGARPHPVGTAGKPERMENRASSLRSVVSRDVGAAAGP